MGEISIKIFLEAIYVSQTDRITQCWGTTALSAHLFTQLDKYTLLHIFAVCTHSISHAEY